MFISIPNEGHHGPQEMKTGSWINITLLKMQSKIKTTLFGSMVMHVMNTIFNFNNSTSKYDMKLVHSQS